MKATPIKDRYPFRFFPFSDEEVMWDNGGQLGYLNPMAR